MYNFKRALGIAFCLYLSTFVVGIVCAMLVPDKTVNNLPNEYWYISMAASVILTWLFATWYFKSPSVAPSAKSGFLFGVIAVVLSFVLDFVFFWLGNMAAAEGEKMDLMEYYSDYRFWVVVALVIVTSKVVGHVKRPRASGPVL